MSRIAIVIASLLASTAHAQVARDAASTLGRDAAASVRARDANRVDKKAKVKTDTVDVVRASASPAVFIGAINVEGGSAIPRTAFAPVIEKYIGTQADAAGLQGIARAIADAARARGYVFASAIVPAQDVASGTVTVRLDAGAVDDVRITGSKSSRLRGTLDLIRGPAVRKDVLERQLLLAGDIPGIVIVSTRYAREAAGAVLIVEVKEDRFAASAGVDNYGSREIGPDRARVRLSAAGLADGSQLTLDGLATVLQPGELAYGSGRYTTIVNNRGTQVGVAVSLGRTEPDYGIPVKVHGDSIYVSASVSHPLKRSNNANLWLNADLSYLNVRQQVNGILGQRDELVTFSIGSVGSAKLGGGTLWAGLSAVQGLGFKGATRINDIYASRYDGSAVFSKLMGWLDWSRPVSNRVTFRLAAMGQIADRPLLAAQELGLGGSNFGRAFEFSERFGDNGVLGLAELRERFGTTVGFDWVETYQFIDGGYVDNLRDGFGGGTRVSAGGGVRAGIGKTNLGAEVAFPLNAPRDASGNYSPRINLTVSQDF